MRSSVYVSKHEHVSTDLSQEALGAAIADAAGVLWVDYEAATEQELSELRDAFGFHPLAVEDCSVYTELPKIEEYPNHTFLVVHWASTTGDAAPSWKELDIFLAGNLLVTLHYDPLPALVALFQQHKDNPDLVRRGPDLVLHAVLDLMVDAYIPVVDGTDDEIERAEETVLEGSDQRRALEAIRSVRRRVLMLRRMVSLQVDVMSALARRDSPYVSERASIYFRDVADHVFRVHNLLEVQRELVTNLFEEYLSVVSNRMNAVMQRLTALAMVFMPLTLIVGIYGTNFKYMPELEWRYGYLGLWLVMLGSAGALYRYFKARGWI